MDTRYKAVLAIWFFQMANYFDRTAISFVGPSMMKSLSIAPETFGVLLSSFAAGYVLAQVPGGVLADRFGFKPVLVIAPLFWALFTGMTGLVAGVAALVAVRFLFGLSEGISNAACYKVIGDNFASKDRARAGSYWATSFALAPAMAGPAIALLLTAFEWHWVFFLMVVPALLAALVNYALLDPRPAAAARAVNLAPVAFDEVLKRPTLWVICLTYFLYNLGYWGFLGWMPSYLALQRHIEIKNSGLLTGVPYAAGFVGLLLLGWVGSSGLSRFRPQILALSYLVAGLGLYVAYTGESLLICMSGLSIAGFFFYGSLANYGALVIDLSPESARGVYAGITSTAGQAGGVLAPLIIGWLVGSTGVFGSGFIFMVVSLCLAAGCLLVLLPMVKATSKDDEGIATIASTST